MHGIGRRGGRGALVVWAAACLVACRENHRSPGARVEQKHVPLVPRASRVPQLVRRLASRDQKEVDAARAELRTWNGAKAPSASASIELLRASAGDFPTDKPGANGIATEIIATVASAPRPEYRPVIEEIVPRLTGPAREAALNLLSAIDDRAAAESFIQLMSAHAAELSAMFSLDQLRAHPHHAEVFFPRLLDLARNPALADEMYLTALEFCQKDLLRKETLLQRAGSLHAAYRAERDWLLPRQRARGVAWMWADDYQEHRETASLLLDLATCLPWSEVKTELTEALAYRDPRLLHFTLKSLLAHDQRLPAAAVAAVAASAEMRNFLYDKLNARGMTDLFPARYRTQAALAESNMVGWLTYPTELGRVPDQIELKKVVSVDTESPDGILDYYLFRFRTLPPHWAAKDGWMAGVAGPFLRKEAPTTDAQGDTFSEFERWSARTPEAHVGDVRELLEEWRKRRANASDDGG
jgi:hypothetical protein